MTELTETAAPHDLKEILIALFGSSPLSILLLSIPISAVLSIAHASEPLIFATSALALIPLAKL
ncbi:MAG TPA: hypothetical protein VFZ25_14890, partial [Chloroflexota bacterium]|nr:hypothetical protein [Chloroflexota bacterium]